MQIPQSLCQIQLNIGEADGPVWQGYGSGFLIHPEWVLTAAHVVTVATEPTLLRVAFGDPPTRDGDQYSQAPDLRSFVGVKSQHPHPEFCAATNTPIYADMALLHLSKPVEGYEVQSLLTNWDWYQSRWQNHQLLLHFWGRPFYDGTGLGVENNKRLHDIRSEDADGVLGFQMAVNQPLGVEGGIPDGFSGGPVLTTIRNGERACVGLTVQGGGLVGKAVSTSFALSTRLLLPWLDAFAQSRAFTQTCGDEPLYQTINAKDGKAFSIFSWRNAKEHQSLFDENEIGALLTWNTALSPLVGRARETKEFDAWLENIHTRQRPGLHVRLVYGEGGVGKTRLVCEWAEAYSKRGWQVADASRKLNHDAWRDIEQAIERDVSSPWLIVMDYPELAQTELFQVIRAWVDAANKTQLKIALVLLSRHGEERWRSILEENNANELHFDFYPLQPINATDSHNLLTNTLQKLTSVPPPIPQNDYQHWLQHDATKTPDGRRYLEYPLMILGQAVCLAKDPRQDFRQLNHEKVLTALVQMIRRKLEHAEKHQGLQRDQAEWQLTERLHMLAILFGDITLEHLKALSQNSECDELGLPIEARQVGPRLKAQGLNVLRQNILQPMTPDVLATAFAQTVYESMDSTLKAQFPNWCAALLEQMDIDKALERFGQRYSDSVFSLNKPFKSAYNGLTEAFRTHKHLMEANKTQEFFSSKVGVLPELATLVFSHLVRVAREKIKENKETYSPKLALFLNQLTAVRMEQPDSLRENLNTIREAIEIQRGLAKFNFSTHGLSLVLSLNNLSILLLKLGNYQEAISTSKESINIHRKLASEILESLTLSTMLADTLINLSGQLAEAGDVPGGLDAIQEATDLYRAFSKRDFAAYAPGFAASMHNFSVLLVKSGNRIGGLTAIKEAVVIRRRLTKENSGSHRAALAKSLSQLAICLKYDARNSEALNVIRESIEIRRAMAKENFLSNAPALASSLNNLSFVLGGSVDTQEQLKTIKEAVSINRSLTNINFAAHSPSLAESLINFSVDLVQMDDISGGLEAIQEAIRLLGALANSNFPIFGARYGQSLFVYFHHFNRSGDVLLELHKVYMSVRDNSDLPWVKDYPRFLQEWNNSAKMQRDSALTNTIRGCLRVTPKNGHRLTCLFFKIFWRSIT